MSYTVSELETKVHDVLIRKEQMQELCKRKDNRIFDIAYNVTNAYIVEWSPSIADKVKNRAVEGKRILLNPNTTSAEHERNFNELYQLLDETYNKVILIILDEMKRVKSGR